MKRSLYSLSFIFIVALGSFGLMGCVSTANNSRQIEDDRLKIVATTTFIGDVIFRIAGDEVDLSTLLEPGQNPHSFQPSPRDLILVSEADLIFVNGLGLEEYLDDLLEGADTAARVIIVSEGISHLMDESRDGEEQDLHQDHPEQDPHVWLDPNNVMIWVENITRDLVEEDPANAETYQSNSAAYVDELDQLDSWIRDQVDQIPPENKKLITDHTTFGYFAEEYGFTQIGAMIPAMTTEAETSGQQLASLVDRIRNLQVKAIFVGIDTDPTLSQRIAEETGVQLVPLYFGSLTDGDPAGTYLNFMIYNVTQIVEALK
jgi:ABC-type Zn uptake system ZnuABC Zn-binding protein ZnuA